MNNISKWIRQVLLFFHKKRKGIEELKILSILQSVNTIKAKLMISFSIPIFFIILLGVISYYNASEGIMTKYEQAAIQAINMAGDYMQFGFASVELTAEQYLNDEEIQNYCNNFYSSETQNNIYKNTINSFYEKKAKDTFISDMYIISKKTDVLSTRGKLSENDVLSQFLNTNLGTEVNQNKMRSIWSGTDEYLDKILETSPEQYAVRLIRKFSSSESILIIDIDKSTVQKVLDNLKFSNTAYIAVITQDGKEITTTKNVSNKKHFINQKFYNKAIKNGSNNGSVYVDYQGEQQLFIYTKIRDSGAMLCVMIPKDVITSQADMIRNVTIIIVVIACFIAVVICTLILNNIDSIIKKIIIILKQASQGDLTVEIKMKRKDEFQVLLSQMQITFDNMKKLIRQVNELSSGVAEASTRVQDTSTIFLKSTNMIFNEMSEIEQGINQQAVDAETCLMVMDNLSNKIDHVSNNVRKIELITESARGSIIHGTNITQQLNAQTKSTMKISSENIRNIESLAKQSKSIGNILNVIREIASETNLLSLNAAIEAARAGNEGRSFAVVANEIRKLSDQSQTAILDIENIINKILMDINQTIISARKAEEVISLQEQAVQNTIESYESINNNVESLIMQINNITENVEIIESAKISALDAVENISAVLEEIAASTTSVNQISKQQIEFVQNLNVSSENLNINSELLINAIQKFKV